MTWQSQESHLDLGIQTMQVPDMAMLLQLSQSSTCTAHSTWKPVCTAMLQPNNTLTCEHMLTVDTQLVCLM